MRPNGVNRFPVWNVQYLLNGLDYAGQEGRVRIQPWSVGHEISKEQSHGLIEVGAMSKRLPECENHIDFQHSNVQASQVRKKNEHNGII